MVDADVSVCLQSSDGREVKALDLLKDTIRDASRYLLTSYPGSSLLCTFHFSLSILRG